MRIHTQIPIALYFVDMLLAIANSKLQLLIKCFSLWFLFNWRCGTTGKLRYVNKGKD